MGNTDLENNTNLRHYEYDLFIAYFCGEGRNQSETDAEKLYDAIMEKYPHKYRIYFFPKTHADGCFGNTPDIIASGSKALLLVGNGNIDFNQDGKIALTKKAKDGKIKKRAVAEEIDATKKNAFMQEVKNNNSDRIPACRLFAADDNFTFEDILVGEDETNPFSGSEELHNSDGDVLNRIGKWLDKVIDAHKGYPQFHHDIFMNKRIYWVGTRQSDIYGCEEHLFAGTICLFGEEGEDKKGKKHYTYCKERKDETTREDIRIDHNAINQDADMWVYETVRKVAETEQEAVFYCYNQSIVYNTFDEKGINPYLTTEVGGEPLTKRFICLNQEAVINRYKSKANFRNLCEKNPAIHTIPCVKVNRKNCIYGYLKKEFEDIHKEKLGSGTKFIVQAPVGSGGSSTYVLDGPFKNSKEFVRQLTEPEYICTVYQEHNVPVNVHAVIFSARDDGEPVIWISTPSIQLLRESGKRLMYRGADFIECKNLPRAYLEEFVKQARLLCKQLAKEGYVGVCGIDGIICNARTGKEKDAYDNVYLLEVNTRFQASSNLFNRGLTTEGYHTLQYINMLAFEGLWNHPEIRDLWKEKDAIDLLDGGKTFANINVNYSNYSYINNETTKQAMHLLRYAKNTNNNIAFKENNHIVEYEMDGLGEMVAEEFLLSKKCQEDAYLYRIVFDTNICWVNYESSLYFAENVIDEDLDNYQYVVGADCCETPEAIRERMLRVKVALMMQGVTLCDKDSEIRPGTFQAIDIVFKNKDLFANYVVNAPVDRPGNTDENNNASEDKKAKKKEKGVKFASMSPFALERNKAGKIYLTYYGETVDEVFLFPTDTLAKEKQDGIPFEDIAYLSTDRLRVHLTNACKYKRHDLGCKFCGISCGKEEYLQDGVTFSEKNVRAVIKRYVKKYRGEYVQDEDKNKYYPALRHFLVGGQTMDLETEGAEQRLIDTVRIVNDEAKGQCNIYAMIVPCLPPTIKQMKNVGLTQLAFNMEIWDDTIAKQIMPGKRSEFTRDIYLSRLKDARQILRRHESVRSMLMLGLEPMENTRQGIEALLDIDVQPMLSVFRPMPGTEYANFFPPQVSDVITFYHIADEMCREKQYETGNGFRDKDKKMHLGPECTCCQNNTLALPYETQAIKQKE